MTQSVWKVIELMLYQTASLHTHQNQVIIGNQPTYDVPVYISIPNINIALHTIQYSIMQTIIHILIKASILKSLHIS